MERDSEMWNRLMQDRSVIVTGAAGGIGSACVRLMVEHGARVLVVDLPGKGANELADSLREAGFDAGAYEGSVAKVEDVSAMVDTAISRWGTVHTLINVAALTGSALGEDLDLVSTPIPVWDRIFAVNARGTMLCCRQVLPHMTKDAQGGSIVNISSIGALRGAPTLCSYGATKAAVDHLTLHVATAYGKQGVRCNAILPGVVLGTGATEPGSYTDELVKAVERNALTRRLGQPSDIANLALFLASDLVSAYVTGQLICCDGGLTAH
jgi:NAD(P)-dependent dehydrogenase (short-subunit alcohol dehydrogenase family)